MPQQKKYTGNLLGEEHSGTDVVWVQRLHQEKRGTGSTVNGVLGAPDQISKETMGIER